MSRIVYLSVILVVYFILICGHATAGGDQPFARVKAAYALFEQGRTVSIIRGPITSRFKVAFVKDGICERKVKDSHWRGALFLLGNDVKLTDVVVETTDVGASQLKVVARFKQSGSADVRTFVFVRSGSDWALDDVQSSVRSLRKAMGEPCPDI